jgi:hypothetical protein
MIAGAAGAGELWMRSRPEFDAIRIGRLVLKHGWRNVVTVQGGLPMGYPGSRWPSVCWAWSHTADKPCWADNLPRMKWLDTGYAFKKKVDFAGNTQFRHSFNLPFRVAGGGFASLGIGSMLTAMWRRRRAVENPCRHCGYSLEGNESGICPECGRAIEAGEGGSR